MTSIVAMSAELMDRLARKAGEIEALDGIAHPVATAVQRLTAQPALKDLLSGTWLGHPLHPLLTDIPIGSFTSATVLDLVGGTSAESAADALVALGLLTAIPTAAAGASDWSDTTGRDQRAGLVHALSNLAGLGLYAISLRSRRRGNRTAGRLLALGGMASMTVGGFLGGYLSFTRGIGVNNGFAEEAPDEWTRVMAASSLPSGKPVRAELNGAGVLLYRAGDDVYAIASRCNHAGGPLEEGAVDEATCTVECPWHRSQFSLDDGHVVHGPARVAQLAYDVRIADGEVEVRGRE